MKTQLLFALTLIAILLAACQPETIETSQQSAIRDAQVDEMDGASSTENDSIDTTTGDTEPAVIEPKVEVATFAGGCFWCMESAYEDQPGVIDVVSGYTGGHDLTPTYAEVSGGGTGHYEAVEVKYDANKISYNDLLESFWIQIDPTDDDGQFADRGSQYRTVIFYHNDEQRAQAEESKLEVAKRFEKPIVTQILANSTFYLAEEYHQDYAKKQASRYKTYAKLSGRTDFVEDNIEKIAELREAELREMLTPLQYKVTQEEGTEPPYRNEYWDNHEAGIYVDIVSGEPLFSSIDKYDSGTGWPSFTKPLEPDNIVERKDYILGYERIEVRSKEADSHLGHVFDDGPAPTGLRYCMNSAALRFIPADELEAKGYGEYAKLFNRNSTEDN